jgi:hypothetical protein
MRGKYVNKMTKLFPNISSDEEVISNKNIALIPIKQLLKKNTTVLLSSSNVQGTPIDNIINACSSTMANLRYRNINQIKHNQN